MNGTALGQTADPIRYFYDDLGRLSKVIDETGRVAEYVYDPLGNILEIRRGTVESLDIFDFTPSRGGVGATVEIEGQGFGPTPGDNSVTFGGAPATVTTASPTHLTAIVPEAAVTGSISVTVGIDSTTSDSDFIVLPSITSIDPIYIIAGEALSGLAVTGHHLSGANFSFSPVTSPGLSVLSAVIDPGGQSAKLAVSADSGTLGEYVLIASVADGSSTFEGSVANTLHVLNPDVDIDNDGLTNAEEIALGSDPSNPDTDGDGVPDGIEHLFGSNLLDATSQSVSVDVDRDPVAAGSTVLFEITLANRSTVAVDNVVIRYVTPEWIGFHDDNDVEPNADRGSCGGVSTGPQQICEPGEEATWTLGLMAAGESHSIQLRATVDAEVVDGTVTTVPVLISGGGVDTVSLERTVQVNNAPAIALELGASTDPVQPGETYSYAVDVGNPGAVAQNNVALRLALPAEVTVEAISDGGTQDATSGDVLWDLASLPAGGVVHREVDVTVAAGAADGTLLAARLEADLEGGLEVDASAEQTVTVDSTVAMIGLVSASPNPVSAGGLLDYEITGVVPANVRDPLTAG